MNSSDIDFYAIDQSQENCMDFFTLYEYTSCFDFLLFVILV
jgi:hypothetical protein